MVNYHLKISGRVQGVGFRWSVYQLARQAGVEGIVMNKNDGSVYCEFQGPTAIVNELIAKVKAGPTPYAKINEVKIKQGGIKNYHHSFQITH
ncbi:acylphosphatase [Limosilactobacillus caviae]|uniref:acylphosphatase n=2 Tax=Limosilactobacillus caviae TaxID=1769424 RepID=A0ABQ2C5S6_9LACO|nr:acylphosphatase [Limosilactobacillus caviae]MBC8744508.1 acylphosphatase [Lactobacillus sp. Marseille-P7033]MRH46600.1 acylphosphatase [Limosilactobacillus reuteri]MCD7123739.1 acylphosphatase [Limosilactobacillus caviae]NGC78176.1 acylphosphatase [Limosilactobacillus reuteri]GGI63716.1 acylphosphatase [Limosilactobacillus caviae]